MTRQYNSIFYNTVECDKIIQKIQRRRRCVQQIATIMFNATFFSSLLFSSLLFSTGQTAIKLSGAEAADRAQCAAPDKPIGY